ncbi:MAG: trehalase family glycosidase [Armatimonadota bacterium]|nr:trehalase family glycosidase [Armatimonadota bacterium]
MSIRDKIVSVSGKPELCNRGSHFAHVIRGPGLNDVQYASGRLVSGQKPLARVALLKDDGEVVEASAIKIDWKPYAITAEFQFPQGLKVAQRSWVEHPFIHSRLTFNGTATGARLIADAGSFGAATILVSPHGSVMVEEMAPEYKPMVLQVCSSVPPDRILLSADGANWKECDYAWSEQRIHYRMVFDRIPRDMTVSAHIGRLSDFVQPDNWRRSRRRETDVERAWITTYSEDVPDLECPERAYRDLLQYCFYAHLANVIEPDGMLAYAYNVPSKYMYPMWWMWDTGFHSILDSWMRDPTLAFGDLLNHALLQSGKGCIPDAAGAYYADTGDLQWIHPEQYDEHPPPCTGPCMTGIAAWDVYRKTGSLDFVKRIYPHLVKYERWLTSEKNSNLDPDLIAYYNWCDVGWDDSKRLGKAGFFPKADWDLPVVPVDANTFFLILRNTLSRFAKLLGETDRQSEYAEKALRTRAAVDGRMWNEEHGFYFDLLPNGKMLDVWTPAGLVPMLAGVPDAGKYERLRGHLLNPRKFWTKYPLPTLAVDDKDCGLVDGGWRGGTWPVVNWQVCDGLFSYEPELALRLLRTTIEMMTKNGRATCFEYYDPLTGDGKRAVDNGFSAMPVDLILRRMIGLNPQPSGLELRPCLPHEWPEVSVRNVFAAGTTVEVRYTGSGTELEARVVNTGSRPITVTSGSAGLTLQPGKEGSIGTPNLAIQRADPAR